MTEQKKYFDDVQFDEDAFRGLEVQACGATKTIQFYAWDNGGHDNQQSCALPLDKARELHKWLGQAIDLADA